MNRMSNYNNSGSSASGCLICLVWSLICIVSTSVVVLIIYTTLKLFGLV